MFRMCESRKTKCFHFACFIATYFIENRQSNENLVSTKTFRQVKTKLTAFTLASRGRGQENPVEVIKNCMFLVFSHLALTVLFVAKPVSAMIFPHA